MPEVSRFYGISIRINFRDHPPPHFHVRYGGITGAFRLTPLRVMSGELPPRVTALVLEWARRHREELLAVWDLARARAPLHQIGPLE